MAARGKGTVTPLASLFPAEEARKASHRVQDSISEKLKELDSLQSFVDDNTNLINLVQRLPDELHHPIMVPFGKGAFFPGRLVHTNELLVLLGDGYFAERTAKQTVDFLRRRGKTLDAHVNSLKEVIKDLKTEASFFDRTAAEATEGLVDIREEYEDEEHSGQEISDGPGVSEVDNGTGVTDDEEYACIMSRLDELEKEELDAENAEELDESGHDEDFNNLHGVSRLRPMDRDLASYEKVLPERATVNDYVPPVQKTSIQPVLEAKSEDGVRMPKPDAGSPMPGSIADSLKAFTGSIIERTDNLPTPNKATASQPVSTQSSKPVSRFKMQRRAA